MTVDSPVAATFVAAPDHWDRNGAAVRAIVIHHAEGGGTVSWLTRDDGNSSHYVVEYTGRVVQMVRESRAAGSMNPSLTRKDNDPAFSFLGESIVYGRKALDAAGISGDPNRYAIAIEVEGFAKDGPNEKQRAALKRLVNDIRRRRGALPCLGHRDQQNYKACPGKKIPWVDYGGHGVKKGYVAESAPTPSPAKEEAVQIFAKPKVVVVPTGTWLYDNPGCQPSAGNRQIDPGRTMPAPGRLSDGTIVVGYVDTTPTETTLPQFYAKATSVTLKDAVTPPPPDTTPYSQADVDRLAQEKAAAIVDEELAAARATWESEHAGDLALVEAFRGASRVIVQAGASTGGI